MSGVTSLVTLVLVVLVQNTSVVTHILTWFQFRPAPVTPSLLKELIPLLGLFGKLNNLDLSDFTRSSVETGRQLTGLSLSVRLPLLPLHYLISCTEAYHISFYKLSLFVLSIAQINLFKNI